MTPAHRDLNAFPASKWARVVQAVNWAEYGLNEEGRIIEKSVRGPLIVWGRNSSEREDIPRLEAPLPSPLEVAVGRVNVQAQALAFASAAHGKVRHSVRWKTNLAHRRYISRIAFARIAIVARYIRTGWWTLHQWHSLRRGLKKNSCGKKILDHLQLDKRENSVSDFIFKLVVYNKFYSAYDLHGREISEQWWEVIDNASPNYNFQNELKEYGGIFLQFLTGLRGQFNLQVIFHAYAEIRRERVASIAKAIYIDRTEKLEALKRYVERYERRTRVRRPLYARPRPPSCPLAPPVTC